MYYIQSHLRIVAAFVMREVSTRYGRSPGGYLWAFLEPIAFITMMSLLMSAIGRSPAVGTSFVLFYATGYLAFGFFKATEGYLTSAVSANRSLLSYPNVSAFDAVIARLILQALTSVIVATAILSFVVLTLRHPVWVDWSKIVLSAILAWTLAAGVAFANITLFFYFPIYQKVYEIVTRPLFIISGVFLSPSHLPHPMREWMLMNPITHVVLLFREGFYGGAGRDGLDMPFLVICASVALFTGLFIFTFWPVARLRE